MTREEAIEAAARLVQSEGIAVTGVESARFIPGSARHLSDQDRGGLWVICFKPQFQEEDYVSLDSCMVDVEDATGAATLFETL